MSGNSTNARSGVAFIQMAPLPCCSHVGIDASSLQPGFCPGLHAQVGP